MKKLSLIDKLLYLINSIVATMLLLSYILPYISPKTIPLLAILSVTVPVLIILNLLFAVYWLIKLKKQALLSIAVFIIGLAFLNSFYKLSAKEVFLNNDVKVMSYNVKMFNHYQWNQDTSISQKTLEFIAEKKPDIIAIQEYFESPQINLEYPYQYIETKKSKFGLAIFSKFKIINSGTFNFKESANNIIFVDVVKENDTIRVYNIHLESLKINPNKQHFGEESSEKLFGRLKGTFQKQAKQTEQFLAHEQKWSGKKIICGDFNNTAFSWVYNQISKDKKDAFIEAGKGFGRTYNYPFPVRIDFILTDSSIDINSFKTYDEKFSDHFPIQARINW